MPYRKRAMVPRKRVYRRRRPSRLSVYKRAGAQLWRDVMYLKSVINVERKYSELTFSGALPSTTATIALLSGLSLGDTANNRDGQSVKWTSLSFKGQLAMNNAAETTFVRIAFVLDRQPNQATPLVTNIWQASTPTALRLIGTGYRFRVLRDMQFALSNGGKESAIFERTILLRYHTRYNTGNAGDITDIVSNALYLVYLSDQATNTPSLSMNIRSRFIDN